MNHRFFDVINSVTKLEKKMKQWNNSGTAKDKREFFQALKNAHPFIFDRSTSIEKRLGGRTFEDTNDDIVEKFSLPFSTSLYLLTDGPLIETTIMDGTPCMCDLVGYLVNEITPEKFRMYEVGYITIHGYEIPYVNGHDIDLKSIQSMIDRARTMTEDEYNSEEGAHELKEKAVVMSLTGAISVKRIGIEKGGKTTLQTKGIGTGYTTIKYENIYHIADKEEYVYTSPDDSQNDINWEYRGFWRGHWRALYFSGDIKDAFGRRVVDYARIGKKPCRRIHRTWIHVGHGTYQGRPRLCRNQDPCCEEGITMASKKMKRKCKNAYLDMGCLKSMPKLKRVGFYTKNQRRKEKKIPPAE